MESVTKANRRNGLCPVVLTSTRSVHVVAVSYVPMLVTVGGSILEQRVQACPGRNAGRTEGCWRRPLVLELLLLALQGMG